MWENPATQGQREGARRRRIELLGPAVGELAEGEHGPGRMVEPDELFARCRSSSARPVRSPASASSSRPAGRGSRIDLVASSATARRAGWVSRSPPRRSGAGATVTLVYANGSPAPEGVEVVPAPTAADVGREMLARADADVVVMAAAVSDYRPGNPERASDRKTGAVDDHPRADRRRARRAGPAQARTARSSSASRRSGARPASSAREAKLANKNGNLFVYNDVSQPGVGFESEDNEIVLLSARGERKSAGGARRNVQWLSSMRSRHSWEGRDGRAGCGADPGLEARRTAELADRIIRNLQRVMHAPDETLQFSVLCLLAEGHLIIEDFPGVGKTSLAKALARSVDCAFSRLQFTPDLLPVRRHGRQRLQPALERVRVPAGPVFANILLVDEINRASPKTQAALLECMQERR
jgi:hypothetical protein